MLCDSEWISCAEALPEPGFDVLCHFDGKIFVGHFAYGQWRTGDSVQGPLADADDRLRECDNWMPLPEPPEQP